MPCTVIGPTPNCLAMTLGNPRGRPDGSRNRFSNAFIHAMTTDFELHGVRVIERVRKSHPAVYLKVCAMLMPRELHVQDDPISKLTDEQLDEYLQIVRSLAEAKHAELKAHGEPIDVTPAEKPRVMTKRLRFATEMVSADARRWRDHVRIRRQETYGL